MEFKRKVGITTLNILLLLLLITHVDANEITNNQFTDAFASPSVDYTKVIITITFLIVLIVVALYILKKLRFNNINNGGLIEVLYSYPVTTKDKLLVVKAANDYLLLGSSNNAITKIHVLDKEYVGNLEENKSIGNNEFAMIFANVLGKRNHA